MFFAMCAKRHTRRNRSEEKARRKLLFRDTKRVLTSIRRSFIVCNFFITKLSNFFFFFFLRIRNNANEKTDVFFRRKLVARKGDLSCKKKLRIFNEIVSLEFFVVARS